MRIHFADVALLSLRALTPRQPLFRQPATLSIQEPAMANPSLLILAGDGIGPEVMAEVKKIIG